MITILWFTIIRYTPVIYKLYHALSRDLCIFIVGTYDQRRNRKHQTFLFLQYGFHEFFCLTWRLIDRLVGQLTTRFGYSELFTLKPSELNETWLKPNTEKTVKQYEELEIEKQSLLKLKPVSNGYINSLAAPSLDEVLAYYAMLLHVGARNFVIFR